MDLSLIRDSVRVNVPVFEGAAEHPVDCEIILPDYCPDIARVLRTEADACIDSRSVEGARLTVTGTLAVHIVYIPENAAAIRCVTRNEAFSHVFDLKEEAPDACTRVRARVEFVNCRPIGKRRVQIRSSVSISAKVWATREESFIADCEDKEVELLKKPVKACVPVNSCEKTFKVSDECEVGEEHQPVASVIRTSGKVAVHDSKLISNKVVVKGDLTIAVLYAGEDENSRLETVEHTIPLSQIVDLEGVDENSRCDVRFTVGDIHVETEADPDGENRDLLLDATLTVNVQAFSDREFVTVADAYSTQHDMQLEAKPISFECIGNMGHYSETLHFSLDAPDGELGSISDCSCRPVVGSVTFSGKTMAVEGNMELSVLAADKEGGPVNIEKTMPFTLREEQPDDAGTRRCEPEISVMSAKGTLSGPNKIDVTVECGVDAVVYVVTGATVLTGMELDDSKPKACPPRKTLTLYFADQGENLWDIAKRYNTSMAAIQRENGMEEETLPERRMLLIPKKRCKKMQ